MEELKKKDEKLKECWERIKLVHEEHDRKKSTRTTTYMKKAT